LSEKEMMTRKADFAQMSTLRDEQSSYEEALVTQVIPYTIGHCPYATD
jgi:hypothetical protein